MGIHAAQVVFGDVQEAQPTGRVVRALHLGAGRGRTRPVFWDWDARFAGEVLSCERFWGGCDFGWRARCDDLSAAHARARAHVHHVVCGANGILVMFDDDDGVAQVAQAAQRFDEAIVVALVQSDTGLVQHVKAARQAGADLGGESDALGFAAGEGAALTVEIEVTQADFIEKAESVG